MAFRLSRMRDERGFTLVELMAVVLIMSILVGIAMASYSFSISKARDAACKSNLRTLGSAIETYRASQGSYPPDLNALVPEYVKDTNGTLCPETRQPYVYDSGTGEVTCPNCGP